MGRMGMGRQRRVRHELGRENYHRSASLLGRGWSVDPILREYDHLTPEDIQACLAYASEILKSERVYLTV